MAALSAPVRGETYPDRPIQLVVPAGAGSSTDTMMRSLAQVASPMLGQSIVILDKPGASGVSWSRDLTSSTTPNPSLKPAE
jgi:putative tricarboxylic transport membrane protein